MDTLARLGDEYFRLHFAGDPLAASVFGVEGYDAEVPDPSRAAAADQRAALARVEAELATVDRAALDGQDRISHTILTRLLHDEQRIAEDGLAEVAVTASISGPLAQVVSSVPAATGTDEAYRARLGKLGGFFDGHLERYRQAAADGRFPTELGVRQAIAQVDAYLATPLERDPLLRRLQGDAHAAELVASGLRPALIRFRTALAEELLPVARDSGKVGLCHVPGGTEGYRALIGAYTTTTLDPEEIHQIGLDLVEQLRSEFAERGGRAFNARGADEVIGRLRDDRELRFGAAGEIVDTVTTALRRAEEAVPDWFAGYDIAPCVVREMDPAEAENSVLGYYVAPAADGSRPGAHVVNTFRPELRARFEYEVLAFHESVPGHHLQIAVAQSRGDLPQFRRFTYFDAHGEGWGLYTERLSDEMGLYTSELGRLGMVSFDAWRACRLVVDTGMHHLGWSRERAVTFMLDNTALTETNIVNEVDRYIAMPGQALAYMLGRLRIQQLRERERQALGPAFDLRAFHHEVLAHGPLPLDTLEELITARWQS
ncbi:DUF885 domain-containing protein [Dactylosporangium siamense]|uniref:DUF885 domain-containing protein n=1 Tax=Dactylosporangium siamense TaxID=685454 RepID=A0A919U8Q6_9ACTN|nr:DUF885 domain-containing protein [Dactylosporangium siamense]GIG46809.1 hypothetical protein Dsi01nite_048500 [Dactylosporangium siamense]